MSFFQETLCSTTFGDIAFQAPRARAFHLPDVALVRPLLICSIVLLGAWSSSAPQIDRCVMDGSTAHQQVLRVYWHAWCAAQRFEKPAQASRREPARQKMKIEPGETVGVCVAPVAAFLATCMTHDIERVVWLAATLVSGSALIGYFALRKYLLTLGSDVEKMRRTLESQKPTAWLDHHADRQVMHSMNVGNWDPRIGMLPAAMMIHRHKKPMAQ
jgi:hypothetical protein